MILSFLAAASLIIIDGDTLRSNGERIRLLGIDAPDLRECRGGRNCALANGRASKQSLERSIGSPITIVPIMRDEVGHTVAIVYAAGLNLSCEQLRRRQAVYKREWDKGRRLAKECRYAR